MSLEIKILVPFGRSEMSVLFIFQKKGESKNYDKDYEKLQGEIDRVYDRIEKAEDEMEGKMKNDCLRASLP